VITESLYLTVNAISFEGVVTNLGFTVMKRAMKVYLPFVNAGGFNVQVVTENFVWRPELASMQHVSGEGHAHEASAL
jgi:hypothetical protein